MKVCRRYVSGYVTGMPLICFWYYCIISWTYLVGYVFDMFKVQYLCRNLRVKKLKNIPLEICSRYVLGYKRGIPYVCHWYDNAYQMYIKIIPK